MSDQASAVQVAEAARGLDIRQRVGRVRNLRSVALADCDLGAQQKRVFELLLMLFDWDTGYSQPLAYTTLGRIVGLDRLRLRLVLFKLVRQKLILSVDAVACDGKAVCVTFPGLVGVDVPCGGDAPAK